MPLAMLEMLMVAPPAVVVAAAMITSTNLTI